MTGSGLRLRLRLRQNSRANPKAATVMLVILLYPDGQRREAILAGVPREGETIRLKGDRKPLGVEHVLWMESSNGREPAVLISVRAAPG